MPSLPYIKALFQHISDTYLLGAGHCLSEVCNVINRILVSQWRLTSCTSIGEEGAGHWESRPEEPGAPGRLPCGSACRARSQGRQAHCGPRHGACKGPGAGGHALGSEDAAREQPWARVLRPQSPAPGPQVRGSLRQPPTSPPPPRHGGLRGLTVSVDEDVHGLRGHLLLHGRLGPADDLQHRAVLLGSHPVDDLPLSAALEAEHRHKVRKL